MNGSKIIGTVFHQMNETSKQKPVTCNTNVPYRKHLSKDKVLKNLIKAHGPHELELKNNVLLALCRSIIGQQLSTKVARVIFDRFLSLFKNKNPKATDILAIPDETLRGIGLSNAKVAYVKNVCEFFIANKLTDSKLHQMNDEDLFELFTQIKGVGRWTVEMILMFTMAREDVFSPGDLGIQKAMVDLYKIEYSNPRDLHKKMMALSESWSPYRSFACWHLWRHLDGK